MARFLIVEARFYDHLNDMLVAGAQAALEDAGHHADVITVPGALEIPGAIALAAESGRYDGFVAIGVVIRGETYHFEIVSSGGISGTVVDTRIILKKALENGATSIVLCHNHPSGNLKPSEADKKTTFNIKEAGKLMEIPLLDHLIITDNGFFSFNDEGIL